MSSFSESIIIPLEVFKKCNFSQKELLEHETEHQVEEAKGILEDATLPADVKIKLHNQKKRLAKKLGKKPQEVTIKSDFKAVATSLDDYILSHFSLKLKPTVYIILKHIRDSRGVVDFNENRELVLGGNTIQDSDIISLLRFVTGSLTITSAADIPLAAEEFVQALEDIGVPKTYIKLPRRSPRQPSPEWLKW